MRKKKVLFVINTMGRAGAETALLGLLRKLDRERCDISLYVLLGQGELIERLPPDVRLLNPRFSKRSVLSGRGRAALTGSVLAAFFRNGGFWRKIGYTLSGLPAMLRRGRFQPDKLLWRAVAEGGLRFAEEYDLAVAWIEGGSAYYVADHARAGKKAAFIHIDYRRAGYTRELDQDCWKCFNRIFAVSPDAAEKFTSVYPEYRDKTAVFPNIVDQEEIRERAKEPGGFTDGYDGLRILTVGRLTYQKGYDIAIKAMRRLKDAGYRARWYVLGDGDQRRSLERQIAALGLREDFVLLGAVDNPYPYFAQADLYVHAVRFEGQGIAVWEAQTLGCPVVVSDYCGSREQVEGGRYGVSCALTPEAVADTVAALLDDAPRRAELGRRAAEKKTPSGQERLFYELLEDGG
mgnify:CR=1 FL=1